MSKISKHAVENLLKLAEPSLAARTIGQFLEGLRSGFHGVHSALMTGPDRPLGVDTLDAALTGAYGSLRQKQVLEMCAWPIFDKPALPICEGSIPEFLWLFSTPFIVQFKEKRTSSDVKLSGKVFDQSAMCEALYQSGRLNPNAILTGMPTLFTREALQRLGPSNLATKFIQTELGLAPEVPTPLGVFLDPEIECARVATFYALASARLPVGEKSLMSGAQEWEPAALERLILSGLTEQGYEVEVVTALPPCSMAESLLRCTNTGTLEMRSILTLAKTYYDLESITLEQPADGWAEIHANLKGDPDSILLIPTFSYVEPAVELQKSVQRCCADLDLSFNGAFAAAVPKSSMLQ